MIERVSTVRIRFRDLRVNDLERKTRLMAVVERLLDNGTLIMGPEVEAFERAFATFCQVPFSVGVSSGTSAVYLALRALGIGAGDEVITTPMSWIATLNCINATGATPVLADIGQDLNIDPRTIVAKIGPRTKAILVVHYTGRMCDMAAIGEVARDNGLLVVEDAAQAAGARFDGKPAGSFGDAAGFSFNPMKVLGGYGESGAVTIRTAEGRDKLMSLRYLGTVNRETCVDPELNHKIDPLQAAMVLETLSFLDGWIERRIELARKYVKCLGKTVTCPPIEDSRRSVFFDFTVLADDRDSLLDWLEKDGIESKVKHRLLMCDQPAYPDLADAEVPIARHLVQRILTLPLHEKMTEEDVEFVSDSVHRFYGHL